MEETVRMVQSAAQAGVEITAELLKLLLPALTKGGLKLLGASGKLIGYAFNKISDAQAEGTVSRKHLFAEAAKEKTEVRTTNNFPPDVTEKLVAAAKEYKIPVSMNGSGPTRLLSYLDRDKDIIAQIMNEWEAEHLSPKENKQSLKSFSVSRQNMDAVKNQLEHNGVECWFTQSQDGKVKCNFKAEHEEKVNLILDDFKNTRAEIEQNCKITADVPENERQLEIKEQIAELEINIDDLQASASLEENDEARNEIYSEIDEKQSQIEELRNEYDAEKVNAFENSEDKTVIISDELSGNSIEISVDSNLRKSDVVAVLEEDFGYTPVQAELAANKLADELGLGENYFAAPNQMDNIAKMQVNIRYPSDDISLRDVSFSALKLKDGENVHIAITNGDNSVLVTPSELSDNELKTVFKEQLGMTDIQAEKAVSKARKIDSQIQNKLRETVYKQSEQRSIGIERTSQNAFIVKAGNVTKSYDFNQVNLEEKIAADFNIPSENARRIVQKAGNQSVIQNKIRANTEKKRKNAKNKQDPFKSQNAGSKKVTR